MGGSSGSSTTTDKSTNISTRTDTNIGQIGITGENLVELAAVIQEGAAFQTREVVGALEAQARNVPRGVGSFAPSLAVSEAGINPTLLIAGGIAAAALIVFAGR